jgi:hypothetical protein
MTETGLLFPSNKNDKQDHEEFLELNAVSRLIGLIPEGFRNNLWGMGEGENA